MTIGKFDYKKWVVENKFGKTPDYSNYSILNEQTGSEATGSEATGSEATGSEATGSNYSCNVCTGCVEDSNGPFSSLEECQASGCFEGSLEEYAVSLGMSPGVPGVDGTIMSAEDQFCIKCQAGSYDDPKCGCCNTDYEYEDNVVTYNPGQSGIPPKDPDKGPGKFPQKKKQRSKRGLREFITNEVKKELKKLEERNICQTFSNFLATGLQMPVSQTDFCRRCSDTGNNTVGSEYCGCCDSNAKPSRPMREVDEFDPTGGGKCPDGFMYIVNNPSDPFDGSFSCSELLDTVTLQGMGTQQGKGPKTRARSISPPIKKPKKNFPGSPGGYNPVGPQ
tara:strand:+ start:332 stop:1336 length:1005 start_codon:yes stop_codon:yes gene_type:complete